MPRTRGTRLIAKQQLAATDEVNGLDYFGEFLKRRKLNNDNQGSERAARAAKREAAKSGQTLEVRSQVVSPQQGTTQRSEEGGSEDENGTAADDDDGEEEEQEEEEEEEDGHPGPDHAFITQAMNQALNRTMKPTINGIGSRQQGNRPVDTEVYGDGENSRSQSPNGEEVTAAPNDNNRSRTRHGANGNEPQQNHQPGHSGRSRQHQRGKTNASSDGEDEGESECSSENDLEVGEDSAFIEAPQQDETTVTVKVVINSMGGIFQTLRHPTWTGLTHWTSAFESDDNNDGQKSCTTKPGKDLMNELQGLNNILETAANPPEDPFRDVHDLTASTVYLSTKVMDIRQHLTRISEIVDDICSRRLLPVLQDASVKRKKALLQDMSRRLIPMLIITVRKACGVCRAKDNRSRTSLYLDCFTIQFLLRPLAWADRLNRALERGIEQWHRGNESHSDADDSQDGGHEALDAKKKARFKLTSQLAALYSAIRKAEKGIQQIAEQAERRDREAEIKRQERERRLERQHEIAAEKQREQDEQNRKDQKAFEAFFAATRALRSQPDPLKQLWDQSQAALPEGLRATSTVRAAPRGSPSGQGERAAGAARFQGGPSRTARVQSVFDPDDPFADNDGPHSNNPISNRHTSSNGVRQYPLADLRNSQQARKEDRPWSDGEDKIMIRAIRYKNTYDVVSMAQRLRRSEDDVARKAAFLKQGYREAFTRKGLEIPAWALSI